jgi:hypothetical protein
LKHSKNSENREEPLRTLHITCRVDG